MSNEKIERNAPPLYQQDQLTTIKVKNINNPKEIQVFHVPTGSKIVGNTVQYEIKSDGVYDKNGKKVENSIVELTRYQVAAMEALAQGDKFGEKDIIDRNDLTGSKYAEDLEKKLQDKLSEFKIAINPNYDGKLKEADATETGNVYAAFVNPATGETGKFNFIMPQK